MEHKNLMGALLKAKTQMGKLLKDSKNPHFKSSYASLTAVIEVITAPLLEAGIVLVESPVPDAPDGTVGIDVTLFHPASGESITYRSAAMPIVQRTPQGIGSAITYARRYHLMTVFGLAPEDDDGNDASNSKPTQARQSPPQRTPETVTPVTHESTTNGNGTNGHKADAISNLQMKRLNGLGSDFYGKDWDDNRHRLAKAISKGRTESSKELSSEEADKLISGLQAKISERDAALVETIQDNPFAVVPA